MNLKFLKITIITLLISLTSIANAAIIEYSFNGEYHDGSIASGTFLYDSEAESFSDAMITLIGGSNWSDSVFTEIHFDNYRALVLLDLTDGPDYNTDNVFHIILQNLGGGPEFVWGALNYDSNDIYSDIAECDKSHCPARRNLDVATSASLTGRYVVPEPSTFAIFALGIFCLITPRLRNRLN